MLADEMSSYPSLIVEVIFAGFVCRGNRFSMLIEATLGCKFEIPTQSTCEAD